MADHWPWTPDETGVDDADFPPLDWRPDEAYDDTPGETAYEAYCACGARITQEHSTPWSWLAPVEQAQWEAAAQAVLAMAKEEEMHE